MLFYLRAEQDIDFMPNKSSFILFHGLKTDMPVLLPQGIMKWKYYYLVCILSAFRDIRYKVVALSPESDHFLKYVFSYGWKKQING